MQHDKVYQKYYDEVVILLETGLRISELSGLTDTDLDFENRFVRIDHQLLRSTEDGYYIETPKTDSGFRQVPMTAAESNDPAHHAPHLLHQDGECGNESQGVAVHHGPCQHRDDAELLCSRNLQFRQGRDGPAGRCCLVVMRILLLYILLFIAKT